MPEARDRTINPASTIREALARLAWALLDPEMLVGRTTRNGSRGCQADDENFGTVLISVRTGCGRSTGTSSLSSG